MRRLSVLSLGLVVLLFTGCESNNKGKIEGTKWSSDAATVKGSQIPAGALQLEFKSDGGFTYTVIGNPLTGKYSLGTGDNVTLTFDKELDGRKSHTEKVAINGDKLTMTDSDGTAVTFTKK
jgi:hypothetical protein